jgi:hypothetical protein
MWGVKSPPVQYYDDAAREATEQFIAMYGKRQSSKAKVRVAAKRPAVKKVAKRK